MYKIFTIGHSTDAIEMFISYLKSYKIDVVVDVRSVPYSRFARQFNKEILSERLKSEGIHYIFMGHTLGARCTEKELLFEDGTVDFSKVVATDRFQNGINLLEKEIKKGLRIVLMCAEKNPIKCHRFSLISNFLYKKGYNISHLVGKNVYEHSFLQNKLLEYFKEYRRITVNLNKIISHRPIQRALFGVEENINENIIYLELNKLIGYNQFETKR